MAKRTEEKPFRPLDASLVQEVMHGNTAAAQQPTPTRTIELRQPVQPPPVVRQEPPQVAPPQQPPRSFAPRPTPRARGAQSPLTERMDREKRVLLTPAEERAFERAVSGIAAELGTSLKASHVLRSCIRLVVNAETELIERARENGRIIRPPNGDLAAIEAFERVIATVLQAGIRSSRPIR